MDLILPTLSFYVYDGSRGHRDPVMADAGESVHAMNERRDRRERGRKEAKRSERTRRNPPGSYEEPQECGHISLHFGPQSPACGCATCFLPCLLAHTCEGWTGYTTCERSEEGHGMVRDWQALILPGSGQGREGDNSMRNV